MKAARSSSQTARHGFSLIELSLALAVAAVALVSIVGVLGVGLGANGTAGDETVLATMSTRVLQDLRARPFDALWSEEPWAAHDATPANDAEAPPPTRYLFTHEGMPLPFETVPDDPAAHYECLVHKLPDLQTQAREEGVFNRLRVKLLFTWPVVASQTPERRPNQRRLDASVSRY